MHISEGVASAPVILTGWAVAMTGLSIGLKKTPIEKISHVAMVSAVLFISSLIKVPVGPSSIHLVLLGLSGVLLGWGVIPALFVSLLLQALLFQFGGIVSLGLNTTIMGVGALVGAGCYQATKSLFKSNLLAGFLSGFVAVVISTSLLALALYFSNKELLATVRILLLANIPLAIVEGIVTMFAVVFIGKVHGIKK